MCLSFAVFSTWIEWNNEVVAPTTEPIFFWYKDQVCPGFEIWLTAGPPTELQRTHNTVMLPAVITATRNQPTIWWTQSAQQQLTLKCMPRCTGTVICHALQSPSWLIGPKSMLFRDRPPAFIDLSVQPSCACTGGVARCLMAADGLFKGRGCEVLTQLPSRWGRKGVGGGVGGH